jgi:hypothetical protein
MDVVNGVAGDRAERGAQAADDARLFTMGDGVVADDVVTDGVACPRNGVGMGAFDGLDVTLGGIGRRVVPSRSTRNG